MKVIPKMIGTILSTILITSVLSQPANAIWSCVTPEEAKERAFDLKMVEGNPAFCRLYLKPGMAYDPNMNGMCQVWDWPEKEKTILIRFSDLNGNLCVVSEQHMPIG